MFSKFKDNNFQFTQQQTTLLRTHGSYCNGIHDYEVVQWKVKVKSVENAKERENVISWLHKVTSNEWILYVWVAKTLEVLPQFLHVAFVM